MALLDVDDVIDDCNVGPLVLRRYPKPTKDEYNNYVDGVPVILDLDPVAAHSASGEVLKQVLEADRNGEMIQFYTKIRLHLSSRGEGVDVVEYQGKDYRIVGPMHDYELQGGMFFFIGASEDPQHG